MADEVTDPPDEGAADEKPTVQLTPAEILDLQRSKRALIKERAELRAQAARVPELERQLQTATAGRSEIEQQLAAKAAEWAEERQILGAGHLEDPAEAIEVGRPFWAKLPEKDRPSFADYMKGLTVDTAPKALQSYLRKTAEEPKAADKPADPKAPLPKVDNPAKPPPSAPLYTPEQMRDIRLRAQKTGDHTQLKKMLADIEAAKRG